jgi:hypothetical protein
VRARTAVSSAWAGAEFPRTRRSSPARRSVTCGHADRSAITDIKPAQGGGSDLVVNDLIRPNHGTDQQVVRAVVAALMLSVPGAGVFLSARMRNGVRSSGPHGCRVIDRKSCTTNPAVAPEVGAAASGGSSSTTRLWQCRSAEPHNFQNCFASSAACFFPASIMSIARPSHVCSMVIVVILRTPIKWSQNSMYLATYSKPGGGPV